MPRKKQTLWGTTYGIPKKDKPFFLIAKQIMILKKNPNNVELKSPLLDTSTFLGNYSEIYIDF